MALFLSGPLLLHSQTAATLAVSSHMDPYRAGGYDDGSDGIPPAVHSFVAGSAQFLTFPSVKGTWTCASAVATFGPDGLAGFGTCGGSLTIGDPGGPFSQLFLTDFGCPLVGMFLEDTLPSTPASPLRFYLSDSSQGGIPIRFRVLPLLIGQVFFIGDGLTGTGMGSVQVFGVPPTATHLYLGFVDSCGGGVPGCYSDNEGRLVATFVLHPSSQ